MRTRNVEDIDNYKQYLKDIDEVITRGKKEVTDANVSNALTTADRERNWEAYMVVVGSGGKQTKSANTKYVYAGGDPRNVDVVYAIKNEKCTTTILGDIKNVVVRIYLGNVSTSRKEEIDWYAKDLSGNIIDSVFHPDLADKMHFFVKEV